MRDNDFHSLVRKLALQKANYRCERCWSERDLEFHHITPIKLGGKSTLDNCIVLCHNCHNTAPQDSFLLINYFLRFASIKEMIKYYNTKNEEEAIRSLSKELGFDYNALKKRMEVNKPSHVHAVKKGMRESVKKKGHAGFNIPFGYDYINGELRIILDEAKTVKDIYSWYLSGRSMGKIAKMLNIAKIPTKKGGFWAKKTVSSILKNPVYCGYLKWNDIISKGRQRSIVELNSFNEVQKIIEKQGGKPANLDLD